MTEDRTPVLIGAGQLLQRDVDPAASLGPAEMMAETARRAATDAGLDVRRLESIDSLAVVNVISCYYDNAPRLVAEQLGARAREEIYTTLGGSTPQRLVNAAAEKIATGTSRLVLLTGAEALQTLTAARRAGIELPWATGGQGRPTIDGDTRSGSSEHEVAHGLRTPIEIYPLFENALRARAGRSVAAHQVCLGQLCARLSAVAADNPYAWFRERRSAAEIATPSPQNRIVGFPYTKYMNAFLHVDQSAALLMTSVAAARDMGVAEDRWVYPWASADATDRWYISEREDFHSSPAYRVAAQRALAIAGITTDDLTHFDLYSCFPVAVQIARDTLGIAVDDPRSLTTSGGLPYAGGPGSNYTLHAIATLMDTLRTAPGGVGLVSALGWYLTTHALCIYGTDRPARPWQRAPKYDGAAGAVNGPPVPVLVHEANGPATIETCVVMHARDGAPNRGQIIGRLEDGRRFLAHSPEDPAVFEVLMSDQAIGHRGRVQTVDGLNRFEPL
jgi:acetyl-CoA C-acetyltransferase